MSTVGTDTGWSGAAGVAVMVVVVGEVSTVRAPSVVESGDTFSRVNNVFEEEYGHDGTVGLVALWTELAGPEFAFPGCSVEVELGLCSAGLLASPSLL